VKEFRKSIGIGRDYRKQCNSGTLIVDSLVTNAPFYVPPYMILLSRGSVLKQNYFKEFQTRAPAIGRPFQNNFISGVVLS